MDPERNGLHSCREHRATSLLKLYRLLILSFLVLSTSETLPRVYTTAINGQCTPDAAYQRKPSDAAYYEGLYVDEELTFRQILNALRTSDFTTSSIDTCIGIYDAPLENDVCAAYITIDWTSS